MIDLSSSKHEKLVALAIVGIFIACAVGFGSAYVITHHPKVSESVTSWFHHTTPTATPTPTSTVGLVPASLPIYFSVVGPSGPINGATVKIYTPSGVLLWTGTTNDGVATTDPMLFHSGQALLVMVHGSDGAYVTKEITLQYLTPSEAQITKYFTENIQYTPLGSFSLSVFVNGVQYTSGNVTLNATNPNNMQIQIVNTKLGSGVTTAIDPTTGDTLGCYVVLHSDQPIAISSTAVNVIKVTFGQSTYYVIPVSASALYKDLKGNGGLVSLPIVINKATASSPASLSVTFVCYGDLKDFENSGTWGSYAVTTSASYNLIFS